MAVDTMEVSRVSFFVEHLFVRIQKKVNDSFINKNMTMHKSKVKTHLVLADQVILSSGAHNAVNSQPIWIIFYQSLSLISIFEVFLSNQL